MESKIISDHSQPFVRRGQSVYILREENEHQYLAQSTASLEISLVSKKCVGTNLPGISKRRNSSIGIITKTKEDFISLPVQNSFVHAAHGSVGGGESWGEPGIIPDEILGNPIFDKNAKIDNSINTNKMKPSRPAPPLNKPQIPSNTAEDLLGDIDSELKARPFVYDPETNKMVGDNKALTFAELHQKANFLKLVWISFFSSKIY